MSSASASEKLGPVGPSCCDDAEECWICLDEGPDDTGKPLVRDCSCRGSTGFAHLSCIIKYAKQIQQREGRYASYVTDIERDDSSIESPWEVCPNCHQLYQNELSFDMANACVSFVQNNYPNDQLSLLEAFDDKLKRFSGIEDDSLEKKQRVKGKETAKKILSIIEKMNSMSERILSIAAPAYSFLGHRALEEGTKEHAREAMQYFQKYLDCSKAFSSTIGIADAESKLALAKSKYEGGNDLSAYAEKNLINTQLVYKKSVDLFGEEAIYSLQAGINLVAGLKEAQHGVQAERLLSKLVATSHRVHGPDHDLTKNAAFTIELFRVRLVSIEGQARVDFFQALRYEECGEKCVVQGPIANPRNKEDEKSLIVKTQNLIICPSQPVICHGLKNATHLNEKIGDVRGFNSDTKRYEIYFEDANLKPCLVKPENIKILFESLAESNGPTK